MPHLIVWLAKVPGGEVIELRLHVTPELNRQLLDSITRLAPWYLKPGLWMNKWVRQARDYARKASQLGMAGEKFRDFDPLRSGKGESITPESPGPFPTSRGFY